MAEGVAAIVCGDDPLPEKPDPAVMRRIGSELGISTRHMLMVGDTINDMLAGQNAAVAGCIGITGSTGDPDGLAVHADVILASIDQFQLRET
jgi:phosphoglycolate phosphatase-like HAD superfamily hydrolase